MIHPEKLDLQREETKEKYLGQLISVLEMLLGYRVKLTILIVYCDVITDFVRHVYVYYIIDCIYPD